MKINIKHALYLYIFIRQLKHAREGVSHGGLGLLARHRRRQRLKAMLDVLKSLKTLVRTSAISINVFHCIVTGTVEAVIRAPLLVWVRPASGCSFRPQLEIDAKPGNGACRHGTWDCDIPDWVREFLEEEEAVWSDGRNHWSIASQHTVTTRTCATVSLLCSHYDMEIFSAASRIGSGSSFVSLLLNSTVLITLTMVVH